MRSARDRPASSNWISDIDSLPGRCDAAERQAVRSRRIEIGRRRGLDTPSKPNIEAGVKCRSMIKPIAEGYRPR
jgi:hypothetical protein